MDGRRAIHAEPFNSKEDTSGAFSSDSGIEFELPGLGAGFEGGMFLGRDPDE